MADLPRMMGDQLKQVAEAVTVEPLKGLGKVVTGQSVTASDTPQANPDQVARDDAQKLAAARRRLKQFNETLASTYQQSEQAEAERKQVVQAEEQRREQEAGERKRAQDAALLQSKRGGGTEGSREAK